MKSLRTRFIVLCLIMLGSLSRAQINLVPNGSFETTTLCPNYPGQINYATGWNNVNLIYNNFNVGSPDFFHACGTSSLGYNVQPPNTFAGTCTPNTGSGFAGTVLYNVPYPDYREYFSTKLICPMAFGTTYTVSFWITNGSSPISPFTIKNIGAHFSTTPLTQSGWGLVSAVPQCEITNYSGSQSWVKYTFTLTATANWEYITLGSFRSDAMNSAVSAYTVPGGPASSYAMYFWDDIEVWGVGQSSSSLSLTTSANNPSCFGLSTGSATVSSTSTVSLTYTWTPGNIVGSTVTNLAAGLYTVTGSDGVCETKTTTVSITQPAPLTINVNTLQICSGSQGILNSTVSGGTPAYTYSWSTGSIFSGVNVTPSVTSTYTLTVTDANNCQGMSTTTVSVMDCTGIIEKSFDMNTSLSPNPFTNKILIRSDIEIDAIHIIDLTGKVILRVKPENGYIDVSKLPSGVYFITVVKNEHVVGNRKMFKVE